jgi:hypothetical protein
MFRCVGIVGDGTAMCAETTGRRNSCPCARKPLKDGIE